MKINETFCAATKELMNAQKQLQDKFLKIVAQCFGKRYNIFTNLKII